jgi:uncharacterized protein YggE
VAESRETLITLDAGHEEHLVADGFDVFVTVRGSALFAGNAAFEQAAEVKALVSEVAAAGVSQDDISLVAVHVDLESGVLSKSSSARYTVRICGHDTGQVGDVLTCIAAAKNASIDRLIWRYPEDEGVQRRCLTAAGRKARERAEAIAEGFGLSVSDIRRIVSPVADTTRTFDGGASMPTVGRSPNVIELGLGAPPTKRVRVDVRVEFVAYRANPTRAPSAPEGGCSGR